MIQDQIRGWYDFTGRTVAITGGAGILGGEIACALAALGANVAILDRDLARADRLRERLDGGAGDTLLLQADVLQSDSLQQAEKQIRQAFGLVDTLINAAGGNSPQATTTAERAFFDLPLSALRDVFDLNLLGTILPCQVFGRSMADQGKGVILNFASMNAYRPLTRIPAYSAAKAGVMNFTQWLAVHMAQEYSAKIRVNAIAPGFVLTAQNRFLLIEEASGELTPRGKKIIEHTPMGRFSTPEDLLGTILWLLSDASNNVTGIVVPIDGGFSAYSGV